MNKEMEDYHTLISMDKYYSTMLDKRLITGYTLNTGYDEEKQEVTYHIDLETIPVIKPLPVNLDLLIKKKNTRRFL